MRPIPVIFEDQWLLVANKPCGLLTIPSPKKNQRTLTDILNSESRHSGDTYLLHPCHRLDKETSGLIIYAKGKSIQQKMMDEFKNQRVKKRYIAFVQGRMDKGCGEINKEIDGAYASTRYNVLARKSNFDVVEVSPLTGRTNQIRIHFKSVGHPIVGDYKFSFRKDYDLKFKRLCLHAKSIEFLHPVTKRKISLSSDLPKDLANFLDKQR